MTESGKLQIDDDWKAQAEAEKQRLADEAASAPAGEQDIPPASFENLMGDMVFQAMMALGLIADPKTNKPFPKNLDLAKYQIDMLALLERKTKGNLEPAEADALARTLYQLRMQYVQASGG